ncbi:MAG: hypothetical protein JST93_26345 [Acidobacteria bacterium]|nr:hypothetical protein [Acidobacteriota bacterium]
MRNFYQPPRFHSFVLWLVAALVPAQQRRQWRASHSAVLTSLWTLIERGEFPRDGQMLLAAFSRECFRGAVFTRFSPEQLLAAAGHPVLPFAVLSVILLCTAVLTGGLPTLTRLWMEAGTATDFVFGHAFVLTLAGAIALHAVLNHTYSLRGWRSALFLGAKTLLALFTLSCIWMESAGIVHRALLPHETWWIASRVATSLGFLFASGWLAAWCMSDQRRRCPACLRRLASPVSLGSWGSVLDPAATIFVCPKGHGSLTAPEMELNPEDQWTRMDASWSVL